MIDEHTLAKTVKLATQVDSSRMTIVNGYPQAVKVTVLQCPTCGHTLYSAGDLTYGQVLEDLASKVVQEGLQKDIGQYCPNCSQKLSYNLDRVMEE